MQNVETLFDSLSLIGVPNDNFFEHLIRNNCGSNAALRTLCRHSGVVFHSAMRANIQILWSYASEKEGLMACNERNGDVTPSMRRMMASRHRVGSANRAIVFY